MRMRHVHTHRLRELLDQVGKCDDWNRLLGIRVEVSPFLREKLDVISADEIAVSE